MDISTAAKIITAELNNATSSMSFSSDLSGALRMWVQRTIGNCSKTSNDVSSQCLQMLRLLLNFNNGSFYKTCFEDTQWIIGMLCQLFLQDDDLKTSAWNLCVDIVQVVSHLNGSIDKLWQALINDMKVFIHSVMRNGVFPVRFIIGDDSNVTVTFEGKQYCVKSHGIKFSFKNLKEAELFYSRIIDLLINIYNPHLKHCCLHELFPYLNHFMVCFGIDVQKLIIKLTSLIISTQSPISMVCCSMALQAIYSNVHRDWQVNGEMFDQVLDFFLYCIYHKAIFKAIVTNAMFHRLLSLTPNTKKVVALQKALLQTVRATESTSSTLATLLPYTSAKVIPSVIFLELRNVYYDILSSLPLDTVYGFDDDADLDYPRQLPKRQKVCNGNGSGNNNDHDHDAKLRCCIKKLASLTSAHQYPGVPELISMMKRVAENVSGVDSTHVCMTLALLSRLSNNVIESTRFRLVNMINGCHNIEGNLYAICLQTFWQLFDVATVVQLVPASEFHTSNLKLFLLFPWLDSNETIAKEFHISIDSLRKFGKGLTVAERHLLLSDDLFEMSACCLWYLGHQETGMDLASSMIVRDSHFSATLIKSWKKHILQCPGEPYEKVNIEALIGYHLNHLDEINDKFLLQAIAEHGCIGNSNDEAKLVHNLQQWWKLLDRNCDVLRCANLTSVFRYISTFVFNSTKQRKTVVDTLAALIRNSCLSSNATKARVVSSALSVFSEVKLTSRHDSQELRFAFDETSIDDLLKCAVELLSDGSHQPHAHSVTVAINILNAIANIELFVAIDRNEVRRRHDGRCSALVALLRLALCVNSSKSIVCSLATSALKSTISSLRGCAAEADDYAVDRSFALDVLLNELVEVVAGHICELVVKPIAHNATLASVLARIVSLFLNQNGPTTIAAETVIKNVTCQLLTTHIGVTMECTNNDTFHTKATECLSLLCTAVSNVKPFNLIGCCVQGEELSPKKLLEYGSTELYCSMTCIEDSATIDLVVAYFNRVVGMSLDDKVSQPQSIQHTIQGLVVQIGAASSENRSISEGNNSNTFSRGQERVVIQLLSQISCDQVNKCLTADETSASGSNGSCELIQKALPVISRRLLFFLTFIDSLFEANRLYRPMLSVVTNACRAVPVLLRLATSETVTRLRGKLLTVLTNVSQIIRVGMGRNGRDISLLSRADVLLGWITFLEKVSDGQHYISVASISMQQCDFILRDTGTSAALKSKFLDAILLCKNRRTVSLKAAAFILVDDEQLTEILSSQLRHSLSAHMNSAREILGLTKGLNFNVTSASEIEQYANNLKLINEALTFFKSDYLRCRLLSRVRPFLARHVHHPVNSSFDSVSRNSNSKEALIVSANNELLVVLRGMTETLEAMLDSCTDDDIGIELHGNIVVSLAMIGCVKEPSNAASPSQCRQVSDTPDADVILPHADIMNNIVFLLKRLTAALQQAASTSDQDMIAYALQETLRSIGLTTIDTAQLMKAENRRVQDVLSELDVFAPLPTTSAIHVWWTLPDDVRAIAAPFLRSSFRLSVSIDVNRLMQEVLFKSAEYLKGNTGRRCSMWLSNVTFLLTATFMQMRDKYNKDSSSLSSGDVTGLNVSSNALIQFILGACVAVKKDGKLAGDLLPMATLFLLASPRDVLNPQLRQTCLSKLIHEVLQTLKLADSMHKSLTEDDKDVIRHVLQLHGFLLRFVNENSATPTKMAAYISAIVAAVRKDFLEKIDIQILCRAAEVVNDWYYVTYLTEKRCSLETASDHSASSKPLMDSSTTKILIDAATALNDTATLNGLLTARSIFDAKTSEGNACKAQWIDDSVKCALDMSSWDKFDAVFNERVDSKASNRNINMLETLSMVFRLEPDKNRDRLSTLIDMDKLSSCLKVIDHLSCDIDGRLFRTHLQGLAARLINWSINSTNDDNNDESSSKVQNYNFVKEWNMMMSRSGLSAKLQVRCLAAQTALLGTLHSVPHSDLKLFETMVDLVMEIGRLCRRSGQFEAARWAFSHHHDLLENQLSTSSIALPKETILLKHVSTYNEMAKTFRDEANNQKAISCVQLSTQTLKEVDNIVGSSTHSSSSNTTLQVDLTLLKRIKSETILLMASLSDVEARLDSTKLVELYRSAIRESPTPWDRAYFNLGKHYAKLIAADTATTASGCPAQPHRHLLNGGGELIALMVRNYGAAMTYSTRFTIEAMPQLLTMWLDFGQAVSLTTTNKTQTSKNSGEDIVISKKCLYEVNQEIMRLANVLSANQFLIALPQLVSRICHPNKDVYQALATIYVKLLKSYPQHTAWAMIAVCKSSYDMRANRCQSLFHQVSSDKSIPEMSTFLSHIQRFADHLISLCNADCPQSNNWQLSVSRNFRSLQRIFSDSKTPQIMLPIQSLLLSSSTSTGSATNNNVATVFVESFEDRIDVLRSLQKPKKLTIRGSDGNKYPFLCKPKDDLRKDARLLEFTSSLGSFLSRRDDAQLRCSSLTVRTYAVTPLNEECGLIEWVPNMVPLRHVLNNIYKERGLLLGSKLVQYKVPVQTPIDQKVIVFRKVLAKHPPVLAEWFRRQFSTPVRWYAATRAFEQTSAVMSIAGYVLGLGDRHTENILLDNRSGQVLHVDFNCLFNKAEAFEYPEVVPFRLTHNMTHAMGVLRYDGAFRHTCEVTLKLMRANKDYLLNLLTAFVYDPLVEWSGQKGSSSSKSSASTGGETLNARALRSIAEIEDRLNGLVTMPPPNGADKSTNTQHLQRQRRPTDQQTPQHRRLPLSAEGQVDFLIQQATDEQLLARMFIGWSPFM